MINATPLTFEDTMLLSSFMHATDEITTEFTIPAEWVAALRAAVEVAMEDYDNRVLAERHAEELAAE